MNNLSLRNWDLHTDAHQLAWLVLDQAESSTNVLSSEVLDELDQALDHLEQLRPKGLIIKSAKSNGFCAGADVEEFRLVRDRDQALQHIKKTQRIFDRLEQLRFPSLCLIHGFCLGGGLELALACHHRIAEDSSTTRIGLPEVKLGIHPAYAGSVRLTRLIGAPAAMKLILSGRALSANQAMKTGIVAYSLPLRLIESAAVKLILNPPRRPRARGWKAWTNSWLIRPYLARIFRYKLNKDIRPDHYPAPFAQINVWARYAGSSKKMKWKEAESVADLIVSPSAQNLIRLFFLQNRLKSQGKGSDFAPARVHIVGAGTMGGDIAAWCACHGIQVTLQDQNSKLIAPAIQRAHQLFIRKFSDKHLVQHAHDHLIPDRSGYGISGADLVIEAINEDVEAKRKLFTTLEQQAKPDAILASNTSSIRIEAIADHLHDPTRLVGLHFFNPVAQMQLVEIVKGEQTGSNHVVDAAAFITQIGKLPLTVKSSPGFLVNRVLTPYLLEALIMFEEGISGPVIDQAARNFGMPMGPMELADTIGLDICLNVAQVLARDLGQQVPPVLQKMVRQGLLGKKTGEGFYRYYRGKSHVQKVNRVPKELEERLVLQLVNESLQCLHEGIVEDPDLLDAGIVLGTGFAPFHGGPMQYAATSGTHHMRNLLKKYENKLGERFKASQGW